MSKYNPKTIEPKWRKYWAERPELLEADEKSEKPKFYCLDMFPYPSGDGLHVGHVEGYTASDIYSRYQRMNGKNVLHPMGWDAFGLPAENFSIKSGVQPAESTQKNIKTFTEQIKSLGLSYDWSREIDTSSPEYYKWTQWFFLFLYKNGLAYRKKAKVNWCESCQTVLANEQAEGGFCERCKNEVIQKDLEQWFFKITDFADDLIADLDKIDWPQSTKTAQRNWIGKSVGATIKFPLTRAGLLSEEYLEVFTTRLDTIYGCTYCVVAPEHEMIRNYESGITNYEEVEKYIAEAKKKTDLQRTMISEAPTAERVGKKTGVEIKGVKAINPFTNEEVPIFIADYVLSTYGTGAVMAVPAHDERDFEFAKKYELPIKQVVAPLELGEGDDAPDKKEKISDRQVAVAIIEHWKKEEYLCLDWGDFGWKTFIIGGLKERESGEEAALREAREETGYQNLKIVRQINGEVHANFHARHKGIKNRYVRERCYLLKLENGEYVRPNEADVKNHKFRWLKKNEISEFINISHHSYYWNMFLNGEKAFTDDGKLIGSGKYSDMSSEKAREEMAKWLEENNLGGRKTTYKLRDWLISRQRYWGAPIPIIDCEKCGWQPIPEKDLPVLLPEVKDYRPKGTSPLGTNPDFVNTTCPKCGGSARRETDTMDTFVCSSWYFFRFADPKNEKEFASKESIKKWLPVDLYIGGAEHTVLHLLYSRFFTKALHKYKYIDFDEPFAKLRHQGMVLAEDGRKMSKSLGNVINPDEIVREYGADVLRLYEMFMGPIEESKAWNTKSIVGLKRFLEKVWDTYQEFLINFEKQRDLLDPYSDKKLNETIQKVTSDIENLKFNTAISALMIYINYMTGKKVEEGKIGIMNIEHAISFLKLLYPFAPHISSELFSEVQKADKGQSGFNDIMFEKWPKSEKNVISEDITLVIQINGKMRDQLKVPAGVKEEEAKKLALESAKVIKYIEGKDIRKVVFVKDRLINFVI